MNFQVYKTAILIPVYNKLNYTKKCLESLNTIINCQHLGEFFDIVIIDDGSNIFLSCY